MILYFIHLSEEEKIVVTDLHQTVGETGVVHSIDQHHFQTVAWPLGIFTITGMAEAHF